ncbi:MAG: hypothetical protein ACOY3P_21650 [Planctomycetota bacterium]
MADRTPNTHSPEEVRRAIQRLRSDSDSVAGAIADINSTISVIQGDVLDLDARVDLIESGGDYQAEANEPITAGMPLYEVSGFVRVGLAQAGTAGRVRVVGLAITSVEAGVAVTFIAKGRLELADWTAVAGTATLTPGAVYYLGGSGGLTLTAPVIGGFFVTEIGQAVNGTTLDLNIKRPLRL